MAMIQTCAIGPRIFRLLRWGQRKPEGFHFAPIWQLQNMTPIPALFALREPPAKLNHCDNRISNAEVYTHSTT